MDQNKLQGKIREQMHREIKTRRQYICKWSFMSGSSNNQFYEQDFLDSEVDKTLKDTVIMETGDSYFVSEKMFDAMNICRCGREKTGTHLIKCLQKCVIKYSENEPHSIEKNEINIPKTSNSIHGFFPCKYLNLERSTYYNSPKANLKHKITDPIYNNIIIG